MFLGLIGLVKPDKTIEHPHFGQMVCSQLQQNFTNCFNMIEDPHDRARQCNPIYDLAYSCYLAKDEQEFYGQVEEQLIERKKLLNFLLRNKSKIPDLLEQFQPQMFKNIDPEQQAEQVDDFYKKQQKKNQKYF